jgi:hypothetical protein
LDAALRAATQYKIANALITEPISTDWEGFYSDRSIVTGSTHRADHRRQRRQ